MLLGQTSSVRCCATLLIIPPDVLMAQAIRIPKIVREAHQKVQLVPWGPAARNTPMLLLQQLLTKLTVSAQLNFQSVQFPTTLKIYPYGKRHTRSTIRNFPYLIGTSLHNNTAIELLVSDIPITPTLISTLQVWSSTVCINKRLECDSTPHAWLDGVHVQVSSQDLHCQVSLQSTTHLTKLNLLVYV